MPRLDTCDALDRGTRFGRRRGLPLSRFDRPPCAGDASIGAEVDEQFGAERLDEVDLTVEDRSRTFVARRGKVLGSDADDNRATCVALQAGVSEGPIHRQCDPLAPEGERPEVARELARNASFHDERVRGLGATTR